MNLRRTGNGCAVVFLALIILTLFGIDASRAATTDDDPETSELVVKLNPRHNTTITAINATYGTTTLEALLHSAGIYRLRVPTGHTADNLAEQMEADVRLLYAEPNFQSEAPEGNPRHISEWGGPNTSSQRTDYASDLVNLAQAHAFRRGAGVVVAVLDTGIQLDHPALAGRLTTARYDFVDDDAVPADEGNNRDDDGDALIDEALGHGTHVAGIIHRVAPEAKIMPLRVLDAEGRGNLFVLTEAIFYAAKHGAQVINLSLGTSQESDLLEDALKEVVERYDIVIVAAAGNLNRTDKQFPASEDEVIAVTAIGEQSQKSTFANYGEWIDVVAPGEGIVSTFPTNAYASWAGTSMATPFVAGQAALIRSADPTMTVPYIIAHIRDSAQSVAAINPRYGDDLGAGRIDIGGSLNAMCTSDGTCYAPDLVGKIQLETKAVIEHKPANGLQGTWIIGGNQYLADEDTEFKQEDGQLRVGGCASVKYLNTNPFSAYKIIARPSTACAQTTPTATPSASPTTPLNDTSTPSPTATPSVTKQPSMTPSSSPTPIETLSAPPTPTKAFSTATVTSTPKPIPTSTLMPTSTVTLTSTPTPTVDQIVQGAVDRIPFEKKEGIWIIDGLAYLVTPATVLTDHFDEGILVIIHSYVAADGQRVAIRIEAVTMDQKVYLPSIIFHSE